MPVSGWVQSDRYRVISIAWFGPVNNSPRTVTAHQLKYDDRIMYCKNTVLCKCKCDSLLNYTHRRRHDRFEIQSYLYDGRPHPSPSPDQSSNKNFRMHSVEFSTVNKLYFYIYIYIFIAKGFEQNISKRAAHAIVGISLLVE